jgi:hypothetical protein
MSHRGAPPFERWPKLDLSTYVHQAAELGRPRAGSWSERIMRHLQGRRLPISGSVPTLTLRHASSLWARGAVGDEAIGRPGQARPILQLLNLQQKLN